MKTKVQRCRATFFPAKSELGAADGQRAEIEFGMVIMTEPGDEVHGVSIDGQKVDIHDLPKQTKERARKVNVRRKKSP